MWKSGKSPLVTIGLLLYNYPSWGEREHFIKALDSLVEQDYENKEVIIIDDCSSDKIYEDCVQYAKKYPCVKVLQNEKNLAVFENFKKLLNQVSGDLFLWACPDDIYDTTFVSKCVESFLKNPDAVIVSTAVKIFHENGEINIHRYYDFMRKLPFRKVVRNVFQSRDSCGKHVHYPPVIHSSIVKKEYLLKNFYDDILFFAEELWFLNMLIYGKMEYIDEILYFRYCGDLSREKNNFQPDVELSFGLKHFRYLKNYLKYFTMKKDLNFRKKTQHLWLSILVLRYYFFNKACDTFKYRFLQAIRKMGFMQYG